MSRRAHKPDDKLRGKVEAMASYGTPHDDIALVLGIDPKTLRKHYRAELDVGAVKSNCMVAGSLYSKATGGGPGAVTAAIFWLKTRAGWKETIQHEHGGQRDGEPIKIKCTFKLDRPDDPDE